MKGMRVLFLSATLVLSACGGGGGSNAPTPVVTPPSAVNPPAALTTFVQTSYAGTKDVEFIDSVRMFGIGTNLAYPLAWKFTGSFPPGLSTTFQNTLDDTLIVSGSPTAAGSFPVAMEVRDAHSVLVAKDTITFTVNTDFSFTKRLIRVAVEKAAYSELLTVANGTAPYTFSFSGPLPPGITLDTATGELHGTPTGGCHCVLTAKVTDSANRSASRSYTLDVNGELIFFSNSFQIERGKTVSISSGGVFGGLQPYQPATLVSGSLPPGTSLNTNAGFSLTGLPTTDGAYTITLRVQDSYSPPNSAEGTFQIFVHEPPPHIVTMELPHATVGVPYLFQLATVAGLQPYNYFGPVMPPGLSMSSSGLISGTPTQAGTTFVSVFLNDSSIPQQQAVTSYTLVVNAALNGRNDSLATASAIPVPTLRAFSLSPYSTAAGVAQADQDYYRVSVQGGQTLSVAAQKLLGQDTAGLDPVVELLDASGNRFLTCRNPGTADGLTPGTVDPTPLAFDDPCLNDDIDPGVNQNASLQLLVPGTGTTTIYVRVFDLNGRARPDMQYYLQVELQ